MDDAGTGRRGRRPAVTSGLADAVKAAYGFSVSSAKDLGGSANLNLLTDDGQRRVVVRVYRASVPVARVAAIQRVREVLAGGGVPVAAPVHTGAGEPFVEIDGLVVEAETFVENDARMNTLDRVASAMPLLGQVHTLLATTG